MTSLDNHRETTKFFEHNSFWGYSREHVFFFTQGLMPVMDEQGKLLLSGKDSINMGPNGNGGCFLALQHSKGLEDMEKRGVQWVFLYGVDNALVKVADPFFLGFAEQSGAESASKVVAKKDPDEKVGVICYKNKKPAVVEYTEFSEGLALLRDQEGRLLYNNGNIANHLFQLSFLRKCAGKELPYHAAHKKIAFIDNKGNHIMPDSPNAYKFELFLFDVFTNLRDMAVLRVNREAEFAPVKNKTGEDSPQTAVRLISKLHKQWLLNAGVSPQLLVNKVVEVSPLISYAGEGLPTVETIQSELEARISTEGSADLFPWEL